MVWVVEQVDGFFQLQDVVYVFIQYCYWYFVVFDQVWQVFGVEVVLYVQVQVGGECFGGGIVVVGGVVVCDQFYVGGVVGDYYVWEFLFIVQDVGQQFGIGVGWYVVDVVE